METTSYIRKPFAINAVRVTAQNLQEVADWCGGEIKTQPVRGKDAPFIHVDVRRPISDRQTKAFVGDWVLESHTGFKCYTNRAFNTSFDQQLVYTDADAEAQLDDGPTEERVFDKADQEADTLDELRIVEEQDTTTPLPVGIEVRTIKQSKQVGLPSREG